ncbi:MAG: hypothetical protein IPP04_06960 [Saprospiraceae bacterium]|nr:hypothetical protein [Saprospiraceae bacterium]
MNNNSDRTSIIEVLLILLGFVVGVASANSFLITRRCIGIDCFRQHYWQPTTKPFPDPLQRWIFPFLCWGFMMTFAHMMNPGWIKLLFTGLAWFNAGRAFLILIFWELSDKSEAIVPTNCLGFNSLLPYVVSKESNPNTFVKYSNMVEPFLFGVLAVVLWFFHIFILSAFFITLFFGISIKIIPMREAANIKGVIVRNQYLFDVILQGRMNKEDSKRKNEQEYDAPIL